MQMEESLKKELEEVESQLICIEQELETLLQRQQELQERRQLLKAQADSIENARLQEEKTLLQATDWESGEFPWSSEVTQTLRSYFKLDSFRPLQLSCINTTLSKKDAILIMPTGGGKSLCYQLPAVMGSGGITLVVSPLVSLMEDQLIAVKSLGIESGMLNASSSREEVNRVHAAMTGTDKQGGSNLRLLYVTPEKIAKSKRFMSKLEKTYEAGRLSRIVIDEVHCVSQWGHDFRPDYKILGILKRQFPNAPILGLTATATAKVLADCQEILSLKQCLIFRASYNRSNLFYEVRTKPTSRQAHIDEMAQLIKTKFANQSGIVYCFSRKDTEQVCLDLCQQGLRAGCYHADLPAKERSRVHRQWLKNAVQVIVATVAFGMGIDKPDVRFVIHQSISKSVENYYQESGRAGRDGEPAHCIVYYRATDAFRQSTMVFTEHTGLQNLYAVLRYCLNETECRRSLLAKSFGEKWHQQDCQLSCDVCRNLNKGGGSSSTSQSGSTAKRASFCVQKEDVSDGCRALIAIIENAQAKEQRLTANKAVDAWRNKSSSGLRPSHTPAATFPVEKCEKILVNAILEGVLKEEFHFTPYSTISYVGLGRKAAAVKKGLMAVRLSSCVQGFDGGSKQSKARSESPWPHTRGSCGSGSTASSAGKKQKVKKLTVDATERSESCFLGETSRPGTKPISRKRSLPFADSISDDEFVPQSKVKSAKKSKRKSAPQLTRVDSKVVVIDLDSD